MKKVKIPQGKPFNKALVEIESHDSWSGPKVEEIREFDSNSDAEAFMMEFNARNTAPTAPEYYEEAHWKRKIK